MTASKILLVGESDAPAVADCRSCLRDHGFDTFAVQPACVAEHLVACVRALISDARIAWAARAARLPPT